MLLFTCQALAELAVLYPVNGAFYTYVVRFVDPSWQVLPGLPFHISIAMANELLSGALPLAGTTPSPG
jgi:amino acid permease